MSWVTSPPWEPQCSSRRCIGAGTAAEGCPGPTACVLPAGSLSASSRNANPASGLQQHWLCSAGSPAHHTTAFAGKKISQLKFLPLQVHDLLSCYFLRLWLIPIFYVSCYPEKHFWTMLKSLEASPRWTMAVCFLPFLFISSKLKAGFLQF